MQKNWLSYDEQLDLLTRRGMWIEDERAAARVLSCVSYYRLSGYFRYWQKDPDYGDDDFRLIGQVVLVFGLSFVATKPKGGGWTRCDLSSWLARSCWFYPGF